MKAWLRALDRILRGETTRGSDLEQGLAAVPIDGMLVLVVCLGVIYGLGMGSFALSRNTAASYAQFFASAIKVPLLFLTTLIITFPSLYVFNALVGSRLGLLPVVRLLIAALAVTLAVLASFGPIVAFFSISTTSYAFMVLLNVLMCTVGGVLGLSFLRQTLHRLTGVKRLTPGLVGSPGEVPLENVPGTPPPLPPPGALEALDERPLGASVQGVFRCWMVLFALVGAQMAWVLRPFIGDPGQPFTFFRPRGSNFFISVWEHLVSLFQ